MLRWSSDNEVKTGGFGCTSVVFKIYFAWDLTVIGLRISDFGWGASFPEVGGFEGSSGSQALQKGSSRFVRLDSEVSPSSPDLAFFVQLSFMQWEPLTVCGPDAEPQKDLDEACLIPNVWKSIPSFGVSETRKGLRNPKPE